MLALPMDIASHAPVSRQRARDQVADHVAVADQRVAAVWSFAAVKKRAYSQSGRALHPAVIGGGFGLRHLAQRRGRRCIRRGRPPPRTCGRGNRQCPITAAVSPCAFIGLAYRPSGAATRQRRIRNEMRLRDPIGDRCGPMFSSTDGSGTWLPWRTSTGCAPAVGGLRGRDGASDRSEEQRDRDSVHAGYVAGAIVCSPPLSRAAKGGWKSWIASPAATPPQPSPALRARRKGDFHQPQFPCRTASVRRVAHFSVQPRDVGLHHWATRPGACGFPCSTARPRSSASTAASRGLMPVRPAASGCRRTAAYHRAGPAPARRSTTRREARPAVRRTPTCGCKPPCAAGQPLQRRTRRRAGRRRKGRMCFHGEGTTLSFSLSPSLGVSGDFGGSCEPTNASRHASRLAECQCRGQGVPYARRNPYSNTCGRNFTSMRRRLPLVRLEIHPLHCPRWLRVRSESGTNPRPDGELELVTLDCGSRTVAWIPPQLAAAPSKPPRLPATARNFFSIAT